MNTFPESDWRRFKEVHALLLERFSARILEELAKQINSKDGTAHDRYLRAFKLIEERNEEMAEAFDDYRRSTADLQLIRMRRLGLLTDAELTGFSEQTQALIRSIESI